jgi:hypothetical protein
MIVEILSGLLIGTIDDGYDKSIYEKYQIDIILNCSTDKKFVDINNVEKVRLPLKDMESLKKNKIKILKFIKDNYLKKNILLLSNEDFNVVICALFLIEYGKISIVDIKNILKNKNICIDINLNYFYLI